MPTEKRRKIGIGIRIYLFRIREVILFMLFYLCYFIYVTLFTLFYSIYLVI